MNEIRKLIELIEAALAHSKESSRLISINDRYVIVDTLTRSLYESMSLLVDLENGDAKHG